MVVPGDIGVAVGVVRDANMLVYLEVPELDVAAAETVPGVNFDPELNADFGFEMRKLETVVVGAVFVVFGVFTVAASLKGCVEPLFPNNLDKTVVFVPGVEDFTGPVVVIPGDFTVVAIPEVKDFTLVVTGVGDFTVVVIIGVDDFTVVVITGVYEFTVNVTGVEDFTVVLIVGVDAFAAEVK